MTRIWLDLISWEQIWARTVISMFVMGNLHACRKHGWQGGAGIGKMTETGNNYAWETWWQSHHHYPCDTLDTSLHIFHIFLKPRWRHCFTFLAIFHHLTSYHRKSSPRTWTEQLLQADQHETFYQDASNQVVQIASAVHPGNNALLFRRLPFRVC